MIFRHCILILLVLFNTNLFAQGYFNLHYTIDNGLPSNEVYDVAQDTKGYIWVATNYGVCKFDGKEFKLYTLKDGLPENSIIKIYVDFKGRVWFSSYSGYLAFYENGKFYKHPLNNQIIEISDIHSEIVIDSLDNIWFTILNYQGHICKITPDNNINVISPKLSYSSHHPESRFYIKVTPNGSYFSNLKSTKEDNLNDYTSILKLSANEYLLTCPYKSYNFSNYSKIYAIDSNNLYFSSNTTIFHVENGKFNTSFDIGYLINDLYIDTHGDLFVSTNDEGAFVFPNGRLTNKYRRILPNYSISRIIQDHEGNYWIGCNGKGLIFIPSFDFQIIQYDAIGEQNIKSLFLNNEDLYVSTTDKNLYKINLNSNETSDLNKDLNIWNEPISDIYLNQKELWLLGTKKLKFDLKEPSKPLDSVLMGYEISPYSNNQIAIGIYFGFVIYQNNKIAYLSRNNGFSNKVNCINYGDQDILWLGTPYGLYKFKNGKYLFLGVKYKELSQRISCIASIDSNVFIGTSGNGIFWLTNSGLRQISTKDGLPSNEIEKLLITNNNLWVGTNKGIGQVKLDFIESKATSISTLNVWDGIPSNFITDLVYHNNEVIVGTQKGIFTISQNQADSNKPSPKIYIENVILENSDTIKTVNPILKYYQNNISFYCSAVCYKGGGVSKYRYKIEGLNDDWKYINSGLVELAFLPPADYKFVIEAQNIYGKWSEIPAYYNFTISSPFWQKWWFIAICIILGSSIIYTIYILRIKTVKRNSQLQNNIRQFQQMALSKQMNPHFLFNSLNSIHRYILENNSEASSKYLAKFSKLMRLILDISQKQYISLDQELKSLSLYLELESMRFKDSFLYRIEVDPDIITSDYEIPTFIIQPFIENAIWHGLMFKQGEKKLMIKIDLDNDYLIVQIEDNGIGRDQSKLKNKSKNEKTSLGINITKKRLELINETSKDKFKIEIIDLVENNKPTGTKVLVQFPKKNS